MDTENGISAAEACRMRAVSDEDFARMCDEDGSLKNQSNTTTFSLKDDPSKTVTIDNTVLYAVGIGLVLVLACVAILLVRRRGKKKR